MLARTCDAAKAPVHLSGEKLLRTRGGPKRPREATGGPMAQEGQSVETYVKHLRHLLEGKT